MNLSWEDCRMRAAAVAREIRENFPGRLKAYAIPNGGIPAALMIVSQVPNMVLLESDKGADCFLDDIVDSGKTRETWGEPFFALVDKQKEKLTEWVSFPWERMTKQDGPQDNVSRLLQYIGDDPTREGLRDTPDRVVRSYAELFAGYKQDPADVMKVFEDGACDEMVLLRNCEFWSCCEHHLQPFFGKAHIAYIPNKKVIGVSKLARILDIYARRLQIQERLCQQVTQALDQHLGALGSACIIEATHFCMVCRGVQKQHSELVTSSLTGVFRDTPIARQELLALIR